MFFLCQKLENVAVLGGLTTFLVVNEPIWLPPPTNWMKVSCDTSWGNIFKTYGLGVLKFGKTI